MQFTTAGEVLTASTIGNVSVIGGVEESVGTGQARPASRTEHGCCQSTKGNITNHNYNDIIH